MTPEPAQAVEAPRGSPPITVTAAVAVAALMGLIVALTLNAESAAGDESGPGRLVLPAVGLLVYCLIAWGLWRGSRGAQWVAILLGAFAVIGGIAGSSLLRGLVGALLVGLLLVPASSRAWFMRSPAAPA